MPAGKILEFSKRPEVERIYYDEIVSLSHRHPPGNGILMTTSMQAVGADYVWNTLGYTGKGVKIAIIDSGINYNHPDLGGGFGPGKKVVDGYDFVNSDADPMDDQGHGTHVAGIAAANGSIIIAGIDWSIARGADIISMSLGGSSQPTDEFAGVLNIVSDAAVDRGVVVVAAAGNEGPGTGTIFGKLDPDVVAPGVGINSTSYTGGYAVMSGTSMATPMVSGAAALILQKDPALSPAGIRAVLMHTSGGLTSSDIHVFEKGAGIINLTNAFTYNISASINGGDRWEESVIPGFSAIGKLVLNNNDSYSVNFTFSLEPVTDLANDNSIPVTSFDLPGYETVPAGSSKTIDITFTPPPGAGPAIYGTTLVISNSTAGTLRIPVVITIPLMGSGSSDITVTWSSSNTAVGTINATTGVFTPGWYVLS